MKAVNTEKWSFSFFILFTSLLTTPNPGALNVLQWGIKWDNLIQNHHKCWHDCSLLDQNSFYAIQLLLFSLRFLSHYYSSMNKRRTHSNERCISLSYNCSEVKPFDWVSSLTSPTLTQWSFFILYLVPGNVPQTWRWGLEKHLQKLQEGCTAGRQRTCMYTHAPPHTHIICNFTSSSSLYTSQSFFAHVHLISWQWKQAVYNTSRELEQQFCECCSMFLTINDVVVHIWFTTRVFYLRPNGCNLNLIRLVFICLVLFGNFVGLVCLFVFFHSF